MFAEKPRVPESRPEHFDPMVRTDSNFDCWDIPNEFEDESHLRLKNLFKRMYCFSSNSSPLVKRKRHTYTSAQIGGSNVPRVPEVCKVNSSPSKSHSRKISSKKLLENEPEDVLWEKECINKDHHKDINCIWPDTNNKNQQKCQNYLEKLEVEIKNQSNFKAHNNENMPIRRKLKDIKRGGFKPYSESFERFGPFQIAVVASHALYYSQNYSGAKKID